MAIVTIRDENGMTVFEEDFGDTLIRTLVLTVNADNNDETLDLVVDLDYGFVGVFSNPDPETGECQDEVEVIQFPELTNYMREY